MQRCKVSQEATTERTHLSSLVHIPVPSLMSNGQGHRRHCWAISELVPQAMHCPIRVGPRVPVAAPQDLKGTPTKLIRDFQGCLLSLDVYIEAAESIENSYGMLEVFKTDLSSLVDVIVAKLEGMANLSLACRWEDPSQGFTEAYGLRCTTKTKLNSH